METRETAAAPEKLSESQDLNTVTATEETAGTSEAMKDNAAAADEAASESDAPETAATVRVPEATSKEEVLEILTRLAAEETAEITREEIVRLKQQFYAFRKAELEAELADFISQGNDESAFMPATDETEERFKELMNAVKDRKAAIAAALEEERRHNYELKQALIDELLSLATDTDNVNRTYPRVK